MGLDMPENLYLYLTDYTIFASGYTGYYEQLVSMILHGWGIDEGMEVTAQRYQDYGISSPYFFSRFFGLALLYITIALILFWIMFWIGCFRKCCCKEQTWMDLMGQ